MSDSVDKLFKKALEEVTVEPPAHVWEGISGHFTMKRRRQRRLFWYGGVAAAVALLLAIGLVTRNAVNKTRIPIPLIANNTIQLENNKLAYIISTTNSIPPFKHENTERAHVTPMEQGESITLAVAGNTPRGELKKSRRQRVPIPLVNGEALENFKKYTRILNGQDESNKPARMPKKREKGKFSVGGYVSPGYTSGSYHQENTNSRSAQFSDDQMSGLFNVTGGVNFAIHPTKRISVETGIGYSRMGQKTDKMPVYTPSITMSSNVQVATPLGNVKSKSQATVYTMDANIALKDVETPEGSIKQQFDAIEIPILFRYRLNNNRVKFSVLGGFGASFVVSNKTSLTYDGIEEDMGETEGIRKFNITTNVGLGMEYPITKFISFRVEPGFKYYLQSLSKDSDIRFKPYTFTFSTGIGINF